MTEENKNILLEIAKNNHNHVNACAIDFLDIDADPDLPAFMLDHSIVLDEDHVYDNMILLTAEEERTLIPLAKSGNQNAIDCICKKMEFYIRHKANATAVKLNIGDRNGRITRDDITQELYCILLETIHKYPYEKNDVDGYSFSAYFGKITDIQIRRLFQGNKINDLFLCAISTKYISHLMEYGEPPTIEQIAQHIISNFPVIRKHYKISDDPNQDIPKNLVVSIKRIISVLSTRNNQFNDLIVSYEGLGPVSIESPFANVETITSFDSFVETLSDDEKKLIQMRMQIGEKTKNNTKNEMEQFAKEIGRSLDYVYKMNRRIKEKYKKFVA